MVLKSMRAFVAALFIAGGINGAAADPAQIDPAALVVAQRYFDALRSGDRQALLSLFAGNERLRNEAQLSDPLYTQLLVEHYRNARFEVTDGGMKSGIPYVDITIWLSNTESLKERLVLRPSDDAADSSLHIVARMELVQ
jgi:hypothetical protein